MSELSVSDDPLPLSALILFDDEHAAGVRQNILGMVLSYSVVGTTELSFTVYDENLRMEQNRYFEIGRTLAFGGRIYEIASVEVKYSSTPTVGVVCRPREVQRIRRMRERVPTNLVEESASDVAAEIAALHGLDFFGQYLEPGGPIVVTQGDNQDENMWDRLHKEAANADFEFFEANGTLFFASQEFIMQEQPVGGVTIGYPTDEDDPLYPLAPTVFRRSGDSRTAATATFQFRRTSASVSLFPGMTLRVRGQGLLFFNEPFMIESVNIPINKGMPVGVAVSTILETPDTASIRPKTPQEVFTLINLLIALGVPPNEANDLVNQWEYDDDLRTVVIGARSTTGTPRSVASLIAEYEAALERITGDDPPYVPPNQPPGQIKREVWNWFNLSDNMSQAEIASLNTNGWRINEDPFPANGRRQRTNEGPRRNFIVLHTAENSGAARAGSARRVILNTFLRRDVYDLNSYAGYHVLIDEGGWIEYFDHRIYRTFHTAGNGSPTYDDRDSLGIMPGNNGMGISFACTTKDWGTMPESRRLQLWANVKDYLDYRRYSESEMPRTRGNPLTRGVIPRGIYSHQEFQPYNRSDPGSLFPWTEFLDSIKA